MTQSGQLHSVNIFVTLYKNKKKQSDPYPVCRNDDEIEENPESLHMREGEREEKAFHAASFPLLLL